jgi:predicted CoA-binding protein
VTALNQAAGYRDPAVIERVLRMRTWAVVGLTETVTRPAYGVARFLLGRGMRIVPVNPGGVSVHRQAGYRTLADIPFPVDVVDVFRRSSTAGEHVDEAIAIGAKAVWLQLGVVDEAAAGRAAAAGLDVVMDTCPAIEWHAHGPR